MKFFYSLILLTFFLSGCRSPESPSNVEPGFEPISLDHARSFSIWKKGDVYKLQTFHPNKPDVILQEIQVGGQAASKDGLYFENAIGSVAVLSTTYLEFIRVLGKTGSIRCLSNADLIYHDSLREKVETGSILDLGNEDAFNMERLIESDVDLVFYYDFGPGTATMIRRMEDMGLDVVRISEYMEKDPLGKAEWIKFFGVLYGKPNEAKEIFARIKQEYEVLMNLAESGMEHKTVFTGLPWKGEWHQPGGSSFQASYFKHAGAEYLWKEDTSVSGILMDREVIFEKAFNADVWLHPNNAISLEEVVSIDDGFSAFKSVRDTEIYNNNKRLNSNMGNDYWESGLLNPHLILKDLISIFQPSLLPEHELVYYQKLNEGE